MKKALLLLGIATCAMFISGCRTVAVVDHGGPRYVRSGYYRSSPGYYSSYRRPAYYSSRYAYPRTRYYRSGYSRTGYYGDRYYSGRRGYYRPGGATIVVR